MKNNILNILNVKGISIKKMSEDINLDYATVHRLVSRDDLSTTSLGRLKLIADYLKVAITDLYDKEYIDYTSFYEQSIIDFGLSKDEMSTCLAYIFGYFKSYSEHYYIPSVISNLLKSSIEYSISDRK